jgi:hypothetical protein
MSPLQLAAPGLLLSCLLALLALLASRLESRALGEIGQLLRQRAPWALLETLPPRRFNTLSTGDALFFEERSRAGARDELRLAGLLLAQERPPRLLLARHATARQRSDGTIELRLQQGELQLQGSRGLRRLRFATARFPLDLGPSLAQHLSFLEDHAARGGDRVLLVPLTCLVLGLLAAAVGLRQARPLRLAAMGLLAVGGFELARWLVQALGGGPGCIVLLCAGTGVLALTWIRRS